MHDNPASPACPKNTPAYLTSLDAVWSMLAQTTLVDFFAGNGSSGLPPEVVAQLQARCGDGDKGGGGGGGAAAASAGDDGGDSGATAWGALSHDVPEMRAQKLLAGRALCTLGGRRG